MQIVSQYIQHHRDIIRFHLPNNSGEIDSNTLLNPKPKENKKGYAIKLFNDGITEIYSGITILYMELKKFQIKYVEDTAAFFNCSELR